MPISVDPKLVETVTAPTNIAVIKYWGKEDVALNTPINSSVSLTLDQDVLRAVTTVAASRDFTTDSLWLNDREEDVSQSKRFQSCVSLVRALAQDRVDPESGKVLVRKEEWGQYHVRVVSRNTFPTAAGLASSAAGYAALVFGLAKLFCAKEEYEGQLSAIARQGSGSACRSLYGGLVRWEKGVRADGSDSLAVPVLGEEHWPELRALVVVANGAMKDTPSTIGMKRSVATSTLLSHRASCIVPGRLTELEAAFQCRDFATFGSLTMRDSNQFHATCLDSYPPIFYLNETSRSVIRLVHAFNEACGAVVAAYTFDAGPNAVIFTTVDQIVPLLGLLLTHYDLPGESDGLTATGGKDEGDTLYAQALQVREQAKKEGKAKLPVSGGIEKVYMVRVGGGPRTLGLGKAMIDLHTGMPHGYMAD